MTLLEALVVVAITAMLAAIGYPALHTGDTARAVRSGSTALVADLHRAHAAAIHLDRPISLAADADGMGWAWLGGIERLDGGVRIAAPQGAITFYPDGSTSGGTMRLGVPGHIVNIAIDRPTGTVGVTGR